MLYYNKKKTCKWWKIYCLDVSNKSEVLEKEKFVKADFYQIDFMKGIVISVKVGEIIVIRNRKIVWKHGPST